MRARTPDRTGTVDSGGVPIHYEVYGDGPTTLLLIPPSPITHLRIWKAMVPYLARRHRVVTFDGRGNGGSGRPATVDAHTCDRNVADAVAVLDATETPTGMVVAHCHANWWAVSLTASYPDRVTGLVAIAPGVPYLGRPQPHWQAVAPLWDTEPENPVGWELFNRRTIVEDHRRWVEFFFGAQLVEPHSTKVFEDAVAWALESTGEVLAASEEAQEVDVPAADRVRAICRDLDVPVLVIHGTGDVCQHVDKGRELAALTGGELRILEGAGHLALVRDPVTVNRTIGQFAEENQEKPMNARTTTTADMGDPGPVAGRTHIWTRGLDRRKRVLYISSPIGLGHVRRDLAIATELRRHHPDIEVDWLAQSPVTTVLEAEGETIHPASRWLASESGHFASEAHGHDLHCFQALRSMDEILVANFMVFQEVVEEGLYDLVVGDEAWDVDHFWHENPELKQGSHVWMTDFVGFLPMTEGGEREAYLTADYNAEMIEHVARYPRIRDRSIFVGNADDIVPEVFGPDLPKIRDWTENHFDFSGYITGFTPPTPEETAQWRHELGYGVDEQICIVTVGGSGVGRNLLEKVIAAFPLARRSIPGLRMIVVAGPRIDPSGFPTHEGLEVRGYVDRLYRHLAVCDLAVVQGGLTTTMELAAAKRPFLYFPLRNHFEQNYHVRHRLDQYGAGTYVEYADATPESIAAAIAADIGRPVTTRDVETDGAVRAAGMISQLI